MSNDPWLQQLCSLLERFPQYGIGADMAALTLPELWGVYCLLRRIADGD